MRIAIYSHSIAPSIDGVCRRFTALLKELSRQGHEILLFTLEETPQDISAVSQFVTLDHMTVPSYPGKKVARPTARSFSRMYNSIKAFQPEVVHVVNDCFSHMFALVGLMLSVPILGSFHTDLMDLLDTHNADAFQKFFINSKEQLDGAVLTSCATTSTSFAAKLQDRSIPCQYVMPTAVDVDTFSPLKKSSALRKELTFNDPSGGFLCVYVGRISKEKRIDLIVEAVRSIEGAYLAIIGDGPSAPFFEALHGKENRIYCKPRFLNHAELAEIYASSDIHVSASQFETLGNTVLEAFACGIPVVVPRTQGFCDTVQDTVDGFLFQAGDVNSARGFIKLLKEQPGLRKTMGDRANEKVANQTIHHVVGDLVKWYGLGIQRRQDRSSLRAAVICSVLLVAVPILVFALWAYSIVMSVLLSLGYSIESSHGDSSVSPSTSTSTLVNPLSTELWEEFDVEGNIVDVLLNGASGKNKGKATRKLFSKIVFYTALGSPIIFLAMFYLLSSPENSLSML